MTIISINNKDYGIYQKSGKIIETNKHNETRIYGSSGGGYIHQGSGTINPTQIHSQTIVHDQFFILDPNGQEHAITLSNWNLNLRAGHHIQLIWLIAPNKKYGPYVSIHNQTLHTVDYNNNQVMAIAKQHYVKSFWFAMLAAFILTIIFFPFFILMIAIFVIYHKKTKKLFETLMKAIEKEIS